MALRTGKSKMTSKMTLKKLITHAVKDPFYGVCDRAGNWYRCINNIIYRASPKSLQYSRWYENSDYNHNSSLYPFALRKLPYCFRTFHKILPEEGQSYHFRMTYSGTLKHHAIVKKQHVEIIFDTWQEGEFRIIFSGEPKNFASQIRSLRNSITLLSKGYWGFKLMKVEDEQEAQTDAKGSLD
jgi:hypothetical protein